MPTLLPLLSLFLNTNKLLKLLEWDKYNKNIFNFSIALVKH